MPHEVAFHSSDLTGNVELVQRRAVPIDATPPAVALLQPEPGRAYVLGQALPGPALPRTLVLGPLDVAVAADDATSGVARVELRVDGALRATTPAAPWTLPWDAGAESLGEHTVEVVAFDAAGNSASASLVVTTVPTTPGGVAATAGVGL